MSLDLNMTLGKKAKPKYPAKKSMNLMVREDESNRPSRLLLTLLVVVIVVALFAKFAVIDRLAAVSAAEDKLSLARAQLEDMNSSLRSFDKVREDYHRYSDGYLSAEEKALPDRLDLLSMLRGNMDGLSELVSVSIVDSSIMLEVTASKLGDIAELRSRLEKAPRVSSVMVYNADTTKETESSPEYVSAFLVIALNPTQEAAK